jgi:hypothetical protein
MKKRGEASIMFVSSAVGYIPNCAVSLFKLFLIGVAYFPIGELFRSISWELLR